MLGSILGDIAGSIYEFNNIKTTEFPLLGKGTNYTDDSIMVIAVAEWLLEGSLDKSLLASTLKRYARAYPNPMGSYGLSFKKWVKSDSLKPYGSWGNGAAMRVAAVGWAFDSLERTEEVAAITAEVTHNDPEGIRGAQSVGSAIYLARTGKTKEEIKGYLHERYKYKLHKTCDQIRPTYMFDESCQGTVPEALAAFLESTDLESAIRLAVSLGGDSDTLACITGAVAEAYYLDRPETKILTQRALSRLPEDLAKTVERFLLRFIPNI
jgi:ADP-ribosylglycohydrolase